MDRKRMQSDQGIIFPGNLAQAILRETNRCIPRIKICGITREREISFLNTMEVEYIGFVFARSSREVTLSQAVALREKLRQDIQVVGVFTDMPDERIHEVIRECRLDVIQLHNPIRRYEPGSFSCRVWRAISIREGWMDLLQKEAAGLDAVVLDTYVEGKEGGTGRTFEWKSAAGLSRNHRIVLAGGLNVDNVKNAISIIKPDIVDVSSGVEGMQGKDKEKIKAFVHQVKAK